MSVPQGEFELVRCPPAPTLQAWDAADEMLLRHIDEIRLLRRDSRVLIVNDGFGALAVALADHRIYAWNDSLLAQRARSLNLRANGIDDAVIESNRDASFPTAPADVILLKIPKSLALLEHQLYSLRERMTAATCLLAAGMARHIHRSTLDLFERIIGPTLTTRAVRKARLVLPERDFSLNQGQSPYPDSYTLVLDRDYLIQNHAGLFSRDRLDRGSRLLMEHLPAGDAPLRIIDLGCGNGVIGIAAAVSNPRAQLLFSDESHLAVDSARINFEAAFGRMREARFSVDDCIRGEEDASADLVLANPPFHQQHSVGDAAAWEMFRQARRVLTDEGRLMIVGNRHLAYHAKLKKLFGNVELLGSDSKFVVLQSLKAPANP